MQELLTLQNPCCEKISHRILPESEKLKTDNGFNLTYNACVVLGSLDMNRVIL